MLRNLAALLVLAGLSGTSLGAERSSGIVVAYDDPDFDVVTDFLADDCVLLGTVDGQTWFRCDDAILVVGIGDLGDEVRTVDDAAKTPVIVRIVGNSGADGQLK